MTPLTKEQIEQLWKQAEEDIITAWKNGENIIFRTIFVRTIERHFGIGA